MKYYELPEIFWEKSHPISFPKADFYMTHPHFNPTKPYDQWVQSFSYPRAMAYRGHQFGYSTMLGDGRAHILGERKFLGKTREWGLKGSGPTRFSRGGDGLATLFSCVKEWILSEFMAALKIPTSRSLAVIKTGRGVIRERREEGGVLLRAMTSFARMGSLEFALQGGGLKEFLDYVLSHMDQDLYEEKNRLQLLVERVSLRQAELIAQWMAAGFIHGVMNTDNVALSGETMDYGPAALMEAFSPGRVFSRIDREGRYRFENQPAIGAWNMVLLYRLTRSFTMGKDDGEEAFVTRYFQHYQRVYESLMEEKLGGMPRDFWLRLSRWMNRWGADYTETFAGLSTGEFSHPRYEEEEFISLWKEFSRFGSLSKRQESMRKVNPRLIPRNKLLESLYRKSLDEDSPKPLMQWFEALSKPFDYQKKLPVAYLTPMTEEEERSFYTTCGT